MKKGNVFPTLSSLCFSWLSNLKHFINQLFLEVCLKEDAVKDSFTSNFRRMKFLISTIPMKILGSIFVDTEIWTLIFFFAVWSSLGVEGVKALAPVTTSLSSHHVTCCIIYQPGDIILIPVLGMICATDKYLG